MLTKLEQLQNLRDDTLVSLEIPFGELLKESFITALLFENCKVQPITKQDRFDAQGLEGKACLEIPVQVARRWVADYGVRNRWQVRVLKERNKKPVKGG